MLGKTILFALQLQIPAPQGYVNDFAGILPAAAASRMNVLINEVRQKSGGEIAVVTLADLAGRPAIDVARDIGREWGVGAPQRAGDRSSNAGVVLLLVPGQRPGDGRSDLAIATGRGSEGFITDAETFQIRQQIGSTAARSGSFADGLLVGVQLLAEEYADEFEFELTGVIATPRPRPPPEAERRRGIGMGWLVILVLLILFGGGRRGGGFWQFVALNALLGGGHRHGGWGGGGGGWGGGGFGGGGFGGFGGGGGFSGGGSSGSF